MTGWVDVHAEPAVLRGLMVMTPGPKSQHRPLGSLDVTDGEVEMELLRVAASGPSGGDPVLDALEGQARTAVGVLRGDAALWRDEGDPVTARSVLERPPEQLRVEATQHERIGTVDDDEIQDRFEGGETGHRATVAR